MIAAGLLTCPGCQKLVYADELKSIAAQAERSFHDTKFLEALNLWRKAAELLPAESTQHEIISRKIEDLSKKVDAVHPDLARPHKGMPKVLISLGVAGIILWKFKFLIVIALTKGKLLLMGLTKAQTFFSMFATFGIYWGVWGWKFALGLIVSIYVHEMGHVFALKKFGIPASAPMFIPGIGAFVRLKQTKLTPIEESRVGLAGPWWGLFAAIFCYGVYLSAGWMSLGAIAKVGAWINLFNLLPIVPLDGGRGFMALSRLQKWIAVGVIGLMWFLTMEGLLVLLLVMGIINAAALSESSQSDRRALLEYCALVMILSIMAQITIPVSR
jgi:Zn-dependent protease